MNDLERAWLAGFIDGEGHVSVHSSTKTNNKVWYQATIGIRNTHAPSMEYCHNLMDSENIKHHLRWEDRGPINKESCWLNVSGMPNVLHLANCILPFTITKNPQLLLIKEYCESRISNPKGRDGYLQRECEIQLIFKTINKRGK